VPKKVEEQKWTKKAHRGTIYFTISVFCPRWFRVVRKCHIYYAGNCS